MSTNKNYFHGWSLVLWAALLLSLMIALLLATQGIAEEGLRVVIRATARTSFTLFILVFSAAALRRFWPNSVTQWLRGNRRYLGVSFAVSQAIHLLAIAQLSHVTAGAALEEIPWFRLLGGSIAYFFTAAMAATSFDRTAAWLGPRAWRWFHTSGMYVNWAIFMFSYAKRFFVAAYYPPFVLILVIAMLLRLRGAFARRVVTAPQT